LLQVLPFEGIVDSKKSHATKEALEKMMVMINPLFG